jgi:hypothetical protein
MITKGFNSDKVGTNTDKLKANEFLLGNSELNALCY